MESATKGDIKQLMEDFRKEMREFRVESKSEMRELRDEVKQLRQSFKQSTREGFRTWKPAAEAHDSGLQVAADLLQRPDYGGVEEASVADPLDPSALKASTTSPTTTPGDVFLEALGTDDEITTELQDSLGTSDFNPARDCAVVLDTPAAAATTCYADHLDTSHAVPVEAVSSASVEDVISASTGVVTTVATTCSTLCLPQHQVAAPVLVASSPPTLAEYGLDTNNIPVPIFPLAMACEFPTVFAPTVQMQQLYNDSEFFMPIASQYITSKVPAHRPMPWPSFLYVHASGEETRPLPWPSFRVSYDFESPSDVVMQPAGQCSSNSFPATLCDVINFSVTTFYGEFAAGLLSTMDYHVSNSHCISAVAVSLSGPQEPDHYFWSLELEEFVVLNSMRRSVSSYDQFICAICPNIPLQMSLTSLNQNLIWRSSAPSFIRTDNWNGRFVAAYLNLIADCTSFSCMIIQRSLLDLNWHTSFTYWRVVVFSTIGWCVMLLSHHDQCEHSLTSPGDSGQRVGFSYDQLSYDQFPGGAWKLTSIQACWNVISILVKELQGAYVSVQLQWGNIVQSVALKHMDFWLPLKVAYSACPDLNLALASYGMVWQIAWSFISEGTSSGNMKMGGNDGLGFSFGCGQAPFQGGRNFIRAGFFDHVLVSCNYYLDQAYQFDKGCSDFIYFNGNYNKTAELHVPWDPGKSVCRYFPKFRLEDKPNFKEGGMLATLPYSTDTRTWALLGPPHGPVRRRSSSATQYIYLPGDKTRASGWITNQTAAAANYLPTYYQILPHGSSASTSCL